MKKSWMEDPIPLTDLLRLDQGWTDNQGVPEAFGDAYLCGVNPLYRRIRQLFLSRGYSFSPEATGWIHQDYSSLSLLLLQDLIDSRSVPVLDNVTVLKHAIQHTPSFVAPPSFFLSNLRRNHLLHESAHCIAYEVFSPLLRDAAAEEKKHWYVLICLIAEAYANAVERLCALLPDRDEHRFFFMLNSYVDVGSTNMLREAMPLLGLERLLWLTVFVFLRVNRGVAVGEADITGLIEPWRTGDQSLTQGDLVVMSLVAERFAATLNPAFVNNTTPVFFRYMGCEEEYRAACADNRLMEAGGSAVIEKLGELIGLTCAEVQTAVA